MNTFKISCLVICGISISACSNDPYSPVVDGPKGAQYQSDLAACQQLSMQRQNTRDGATSGAVIGGLVGAADADEGDELGSAVAGAVIGGLLGNAGENEEVQEQRDKIVFNCLRGRGHKVVG